MKLWLSCEVRTDKHDTYWGYGLLVDWPSKRILDFYTSKAPEVPGAPQGIRRMARLKHSDYQLVLWNNRIEMVYSEHAVKLITHPWLFGPHAIQFEDDDTFWVDCNMRDSLMRMNTDGDVLEEVRLDASKPALDEDFKTVPDEQLTAWREEGLVDRLHINTIQRYKDNLYAGCSTPRAFIRFKPDIKRICQCGSLSGPHDFHIIGDYIVVGDSGHGTIVRFKLGDDKTMGWLPTNRFAGIQSVNAAVGWTRGLVQLDEDRILVGSSPLSVYQINVKTWEIEDWAVFAGDVAHACHGIDVYEE